MSEISKKSGLNFSDLKKIEYVFRDEILSCEINLSDLKATINLKTGFAWKNIYFSPGSVDHKLDEERETPAGIIYDQQLTIREPKVSNDLSALFFKMKGRPVVLRITDVNKNIFLMGSDIHFVKVKTPARTTVSNGYQVGFSVSLPHPLPFIQTWQEAADFGGGGES